MVSHFERAFIQGSSIWARVYNHEFRRRKRTNWVEQTIVFRRLYLFGGQEKTGHEGRWPVPTWLPRQSSYFVETALNRMPSPSTTLIT
jgi:hypothetical protein